VKKITSIQDIDLSPQPGKKYWNCDREWREEFIYFLMVNRFHDDHDRTSKQGPDRLVGFGSEEQLKSFCGGTIKGITKHLDYIKGLGCTSIWLSPVFQNNENSYHGYAIENFLAVDPRFGTKEDLIELVRISHEKNIRVFLDVVLNHSGDNWFYLGGFRYFYDKGMQFPFGGWRKEDSPLPVELRNPEYYSRMGEIRNWDINPETKDGDFFSLKGFLNDDSPEGLALQNILIKIHCYWMKEVDFDGFRLDAVKHMGEVAVARFCSEIREYAYRIGKKNFFLFGELVGGDEACNKYIGPNTSRNLGDKNIYFGLDSVLDFPLHYTLPSVIKGIGSPVDLINRYEALRYNALNRGELGRYLVTFLDNHDQVGYTFKKRFSAGALDDQVIAGLGFLLCSLGTPCIYYGTEQGFSGQGDGDEFIREAMFDLNDTRTNALNTEGKIYKEIGAIAKISRQSEVLKFGRMYIREISSNGVDFSLPQSQPCTLAFSRVLSNEEILVAFNTSTNEMKSDYVIVNNGVGVDRLEMKYLYGGEGTVAVQRHPHPGNTNKFVKLELQPLQFVILK
jgi:alpha-amylase